MLDTINPDIENVCVDRFDVRHFLYGTVRQFRASVYQKECYG